MFRFKKHIEVFKTEDAFKEMMKKVQEKGLAPSLPRMNFKILTILGFKPTTYVLPSEESINVLEKLITQGSLTKMKVQKELRRIITSKPTIHFYVIFNSYPIYELILKFPT